MPIEFTKKKMNFAICNKAVALLSFSDFANLLPGEGTYVKGHVLKYPNRYFSNDMCCKPIVFSQTALQKCEEFRVAHPVRINWMSSVRVKLVDSGRRTWLSGAIIWDIAENGEGEVAEVAEVAEAIAYDIRYCSAK